MIKSYVYKITNNLNGKIYVGVHTTKNDPFNDKYMGSGNIIKLAIKKHGVLNFYKLILGIFHDKLLAYTYLKIIVNQLFVDDPMTYNMKVGGKGGSVKGKTKSELHKTKLSLSLKGHKVSELTKRKISLTKIRKGK